MFGSQTRIWEPVTWGSLRIPCGLASGNWYTDAPARDSKPMTNLHRVGQTPPEQNEYNRK